MMKPDEVEAMLGLYELGWGTKRIAGEFGYSRNTVKRYVEAQGWVAYGGPRRSAKLAGLDGWLEERFFRHRSNAEVVRQDLERELSIGVSLRTVECAVAPYRQQLVAEAKATLRFETPPGRQLQIDFGTSRVSVGGGTQRVYLFVATLGYSRRTYVQAFRNERQAAWFAGIEGAFRHFGGVTDEVLVDNPKALVVHHDAATREVQFNERFLALAAHWGFRPRACAPYRARTKGKDENGVRYSEAQRHRRPPVRESGRARRPPGVVDAGDRRRASPRHLGRDAAGTLRARGRAAGAMRRPTAVRTAARSHPHGARRLRGDGGYQRVLRALAVDRRACTRGGEWRPRSRTPRPRSGR